MTWETLDHKEKREMRKTEENQELQGKKEGLEINVWRVRREH